MNFEDIDIVLDICADYAGKRSPLDFIDPEEPSYVGAAQGKNFIEVIAHFRDVHCEIQVLANEFMFSCDCYDATTEDHCLHPFCVFYYYGESLLKQQVTEPEPSPEPGFLVPLPAEVTEILERYRTKTLKVNAKTLRELNESTLTPFGRL